MAGGQGPADLPVASEKAGHRTWVRVCHWVAAGSFLFLCFSGIYIFAVHPRLYWGEVGNDLMPALLEIPITANHQPDGWERTATFPIGDGQVYTASRTYPIFNQNGWARSLHFLAAWFFLVTGMFYVLAGLVSGHARRDLLPKGGDFSLAKLKQDVKEHLRPSPGAIGVGPPYGIVQRISYGIVLFIAMPLMVITGLAMAPAITAALPILLDIFGGYQSARTVHFFSFAVILLFFVVHVAMVFVAGFGRQMRAMILGSSQGK